MALTVPLLIVGWFVLLFVYWRRNDKYVNNLGENVFIDGKFPKVDCISTPSPCFKNSDCLRLCDGTDIFECNDTAGTGICIFKSSGGNDPDPDSEECNASHGILRVLEYDQVTGQVLARCKSVVAPYVYNDNDTLNEKWCLNGSFDVDLLKENIDAAKCKCDSDSLKVFSSDYPLCVEKKYISMVPEFALDERYKKDADWQAYMPTLMNKYNSQRQGRYVDTSDHFGQDIWPYF